MTRLFGRYSVGSYARTATLRGLASSMDLTGNTCRQHHFFSTSAEADRAAIANDWQMVGDSLREVVEEHRSHR